MSFPYLHANGGICCSVRTACCDECKAKLAAEQRTLRSAQDFTPPDPYARDIARLRARDAKAAAARTYQPPRRPTTMPVDANGIPDPYAAGLAALKRENR